MQTHKHTLTKHTCETWFPELTLTSSSSSPSHLLILATTTGFFTTGSGLSANFSKITTKMKATTKTITTMKNKCKCHRKFCIKMCNNLFLSFSIFLSLSPSHARTFWVALKSLSRSLFDLHFYSCGFFLSLSLSLFLCSRGFFLS